MAKIVRSIKYLKISAGNFMGADLLLGTSGKFSRGRPAIFERKFSHLTVTQSFSSFLKLTVASGRRREMSKSFRACTHIAPGVLLMSASVSQRIVTSRSVPMMRMVFSPTDSMRMLESTGMVFFFSTMPWTKPSSFCKATLLMVNSIDENSSEDDGVLYASQ